MRIFAPAMKMMVTDREKGAAEYTTAMGILWSLCLAHLCNDAFQSVIPAVYPLLKDNLALTFAQVGMITLVYQICASVFQPVKVYLLRVKPFVRTVATAP